MVHYPCHHWLYSVLGREPKVMGLILFYRVSSMIHQYIDGMDSCGNFWQMVARNWRSFLPVFNSTGEKLTRATLRAIFKPLYSQEGSNRRDQEEDTIFSFERWLVAIEGKCLHIW